MTEKVASYLKSLGIIGLGPWIFAVAQAKPASLLVRLGSAFYRLASERRAFSTKINIDLLVG
jgi:hypothetical protein